jgi:hypothetical protein
MSASIGWTNSPDPREIVIDARPFNRNGLADWNSLEIWIQGKTAAGQSCLVRGSMKCTLWTRQTQLVRSVGENYFEDPRDLVRLGQWSQFVDGSEVDATGVQKIVVSLPPRPADQNLNWGEFAFLTVDLDVPGYKRLSASMDSVPLRQLGPNRYRSAVDYGHTLLPLESTSEGTFNQGDWPAPLSDLRPDRRRFTVQP